MTQVCRFSASFSLEDSLLLLVSSSTFTIGPMNHLCAEDTQEIDANMNTDITMTTA